MKQFTIEQVLSASAQSERVSTNFSIAYALDDPTGNYSRQAFRSLEKTANALGFELVSIDQH